MPEEPALSPVYCTTPDCPWYSDDLPTADIEARQTVLNTHLAEVHPSGEEPDAGPAAIRTLHEGFLNTAVVTGMRTATDPRPHIVAERSQGVAAAWSAHRLMRQLAEVDPNGAKAFALELVAGLQDGSYVDGMDDDAAGMGFPATDWISTEQARQDAEEGSAS